MWNACISLYCTNVHTTWEFWKFKACINFEIRGLIIYGAKSYIWSFAVLKVVGTFGAVFILISDKLVLQWITSILNKLTFIPLLRTDWYLNTNCLKYTIILITYHEFSFVSFSNNFRKKTCCCTRKCQKGNAFIKTRICFKPILYFNISSKMFCLQNCLYIWYHNYYYTVISGK